MNLSRSVWSLGTRVSNLGLSSFSTWTSSIARGLCSVLQKQPSNERFIDGNQPNLLIQILRHNKRGMDYRPNNLKRIKRHGRKKRLSTTSGKIILIRRMMKNVNPRVLTH